MNLRSKIFKKIVSCVLSAAMVLSSFAIATPVFAGDTWPLEGDAVINVNHPRTIGQRVYDIENWDPDSEPYADLMRASVPLQERNDAFTATQANPNLTSKAEIYNMGGDYGNSFFEATPYNNEFSEFAFNFWQYIDYYASWHGVTTKGAPIDEYDPDGPWQQRYFEFGLINIPNPAYTNAAHKNGVKSIGCIFLPRAGQTHSALLKKDENGEFPVAKKLVEFTKYYGFDGYFINQEETIPKEDVEPYKEFTKYLNSQGIWTQWYDSLSPTGNLGYQNKLNANNATWIHDAEYGLGKVNSSLFVNYDWFRGSNLQTSFEYAEANGIDLFTETYFGVEANQAKFSGSHGSSQIEMLYAPGTKNLRASLALFTPTDFIQNQLDENLTGQNANNWRADDDYQWMIMERERMYYSGVAQDPTNTGRMKGYENPTIGVKDASGWAGVADFAYERSVVADNTFYTNFNTGHGLEYRENGVITNDEEWSNMNLQDILPSWQWWIETPKKTSLKKAAAAAPVNGAPQTIGAVDTVQEAPAYAAYAAQAAATGTAHTITVSEDVVNGKLNLTKTTANAGEWIYITLQADPGYRINVDSVKYNGNKANYYAYQNYFSFLMPDEDVVITGEFEKIPTHAATIENTPHGTLTVDAENPAEIAEGTTVTVTATPDEGYQLKKDSLKVNGEVLKDTMSFIMPTGDVTITAEFELPPYEKLHADFDYGEDYFTGAADFEPIGAYKGGSSLVLSGKLEAHNFLHLYKTDLQVKDSSTMSLTYYKPSKSDGTEMQLALIFKSNPDEVKYIPIAGSGTKTNGWKTVKIDLSAYAGEDIAVIGLGFNPKQGEVENYQMNIGEIKFTDGADYTPAAPENFRITKAFSTGDMIVKWDMADYDEVHQYNIYANLSDGTRRFVGGLYGDTFYIKSLYGEDKNVTLELCAVGKDGTESTAATVSYDFENAASGVMVEEEYTANHNKLQSANAGFLNVSWTNPAADYESMELTVTPVKYHDYKVREEVYTKTVKAGVTSTLIKTPIADGSEYDLALTPVYADGTKGDTIHYTGYFKDTYIEPYDEGYEFNSNGNTITFNVPKSEDWWHMYVYANGQPLTFRSEYDTAKQFAIRGKSFIHNVPLPANFTNGVIEVVLEDYSGNRSEPSMIYRCTDETAEINETMFPDAALLAAVREQAGTTVKEVMDFDGTLDLSGLNIQDYTGLNLLAHIKTLDLSDNDLTAIPAGMINTYAEKIILKDCKELQTIPDGAFSTCSNLKELDITGCTALKVLYLNDTNLEMLTYGDAEDFENLVTVNLSGAKFDMSEGTPERAFVDAAAEFTADEDDIIIPSPNETNLALNPKIVSTTLSDSYAKALFDGNTTMISMINSWPAEVVIDIGSAQAIERYVTTLFSNEGFSPQGMKIYGSNDTENFTLIASRNGFENVWADDIADPQPYRYYKIVFEHPSGGYKYVYEVQLFGHATERHMAGVTYGNQRPNAYTAEIPAEITLDRQDASMNLNDLLSETIRGTSLADLAGADFLAEDYELNNPAHVAYIDNGEITFNNLDLSKDGTYNVTFTSFETIDLNGKVLGETVIKVGNGGVVPADKSALEALVDTAEDIDTSKYTDETVKTLEDALARAKDVLAKEDAVQEEVDAAYDALEEALNGLTEKDPSGGNTGNTGTPDTGDYGMGLTMVLLFAALGTALFVFRRRLAK